MAEKTTKNPSEIQLLGDKASATIAQINACKEGIQKATVVLSQYTAVDSEEARTAANTAINKAKKNVKQVQDIRLSFTREIDAYKNKFMEAEKKLLAPLLGAIAEAEQACNQFVRAERLRMLEEQKRIEAEKAAQLAAANEKPEGEAELIRMQAEFQAQASQQQLGTLGNVTQKWVAVKDPGARWDEALLYYLSKGGDESKLHFLLDFLLKNGRPEIDGIQYIPEIKNVARA